MTGLAAPVLWSTLLIAVALPLLVWAAFTRATMTRKTMLVNLNRQLDQHRAGAALDDAYTPSGEGALVSKFIPRPLVRNLDRLHARSGRPARWPMERILVLKVLGTVAGVLLAYFLWQSAPSAGRLLLGLVVGTFVAFLPEMLLLSNANRRRERIALKLPDTMDQLSIAVEAGLGFEGALRHVAGNTTGPLADEIVRTLQDIQVGVPRRTAYQALSDRVELPALRRFIRAIIQAEQHGISIARVLQIQATEMRVIRRLTAEEKAMRIPVLVAFPMFLCIFPALLVVVLGPAIINIIDAFTGGLVGP
ncbi:type II secretion system F family protein [Ornithinimicrobium tianjinense]|nr:type II secretion system F family protein [Ornithinimicrobium tianjinense]